MKSIPNLSKSFILLSFLVAACRSQPVEPSTLPTVASSPLPLPTATDLPFLPTDTPTLEPESGSGAPGLLAFYSDRDGNPEIYVMNADGSGLARLTNDPGFDDSPALSPDGRQIAFLTARHDPNPKFPDLKYELYVMDVDGSNLLRLTTTDGAEDHPAWSPNGKWISFDADYDGDGFYEIYSVQPDGSNLNRLTSGSYNDQFADWSPDGKQIAFSSDRNGNWDIFVMNVDGSNQRAITHSPNWELFPAWSPDGSRIAFNGLAPRSRNTDVYVMNQDGSEVRQLTSTTRFDENPVWSPDGRLIAFQTERDGNFELYSMNADGSNPRPLNAHPSEELWPSWGTVKVRQTILVIFGNNFIREIYTTIRPLFEQAGYTVVVASRQIAPMSSKDGALKVIPDLLLEDVNVVGYDAIVFSCDNDISFGSAKEEANRIIHEALEQGKIVAAICAAPRVLGDAGVVEGVHVTGEPSATCALLQSSHRAICTNKEVEQDGLIITAKDRSSRTGFALKVLAALESQAVPTPAPLLTLVKSTQAFGSPETFQAGLDDLDGDGDLDAVYANPMRNHAAVWLNNGDGTFTDTGQQLTQYGHGVGLADFDGDDDLDAVIVCHQFVTPSRVYLNDGTGNFSDHEQDLGDKNISAADVNLLDINGDGYIDIHVMYYAPSGLPDKVYLNDGRANFHDSGLSLDEEIIAWGDLDGDGDADYFGKRPGSEYVVQINDGSGNFTIGWRMEDAQASVGGIVLADFDADGDLDALVANGFRQTGSFPTHLFWNDGHGQFSDSGLVLNETMGAELAAGDLDQDGDLDVFVSNMDLPNEVWLYHNGQLVDSGLRLGENTDMSGKATLGDLDGDGDLDVIVGRFRNGAEIWFNQTQE